MFKCIKYYDGSFNQEAFDKTLLASKDQDGLMSKEDKIKLDNLNGGVSTPTDSINNDIKETINSIMNGTSIVPKAQTAETVNGYKVEANVPSNAIFTDTIYTHPETHNAEMIIESEERKFITAEQLSKLDNMPKFVNTPYFDEEENSLFACGIPVIISASNNEGKAICEYVSDGKKSFEFPAGTTVSIYGGGNGKINTPFYPATCVTINSGTFKTVTAGNVGSGAVGTSSVIINGGNIEFIQASKATDGKEYNNILGHFNIIINGDSNITCIYGGPQGLGTVGSAKITMNGGSAQWLTAGGSNGYTGEAEVIINNGDINVLQGCNRGSMGNIKITINNGNIQRMYAGGETEDTSVTATYIKSELFVNGGTISNISSGTNGGVQSSTNVSGEYIDGLISSETASALNLIKAPMKFTDIMFESGNLVFKNSDIVVKSITLV